MHVWQGKCHAAYVLSAITWSMNVSPTLVTTGSLLGEVWSRDAPRMRIVQPHPFFISAFLPYLTEGVRI